MATVNRVTDLQDTKFFPELDGAGVQAKSFASVQSMGEGGFTFTYRLARITFPKVREFGLKWDERSRTMWGTKQTVKDSRGQPYELSAIQSRNPNAVNGRYFGADFKRGIDKARDTTPAEEGKLKTYIDSYKKGFAKTFPTGLNNAPNFILASQDFRSDIKYDMEGEVKGIETGQELDWDKNVMAALNDKGPLGPGKLKNRFLQLNKIAHQEVLRRYDDDVLPESVKKSDNFSEVLVPVRMTKFPKSELNHAGAFDYGSLLTDFFEKDRESTREIERKLKVTSVELIKTLANNIETTGKNDPVRIPAELDGDEDFKMPLYKVNEDKTEDDTAEESGNRVRFWQPHNNELLTAVGPRRQWRMALLEYEPLMNLDVTSTPENMFSNHFSLLPAYNQTFQKSRLLNIRQYVAVIFLVDSNGVQQYYAVAPEKLENLSALVEKFHQAVKTRSLSKPSIQGGMEHHRISSFDPSSGFHKDYNDTLKRIKGAIPLTYNVFSKSEIESDYKPSLYDDMWDSPIPLGKESDTPKSPIKFDLNKASENQRFYQYLSKLPELTEQDPDTSDNYMESIAGYYAEDTVTNLLSVPQTNQEGQTTLKMRRKVKSTLSTRQIQVIINPVVNQALQLLRDQLGSNRVSSLSMDQRERLNRQMEDIFRKKGNLYISFIFGTVLDNALTQQNLGMDLRDTIAYRNMAQVLLDTVPFIHNLGRFEAIHVFQKDVIEKMISIAQGLDHPRVEVMLQNALYHAVGRFMVNGKERGNKAFGCTPKEILENTRTIEKNISTFKKTKGDEVNNLSRNSIVKLNGTLPTRYSPIEANELPQKKKDLIENFDYYALAVFDKEVHENVIKGVEYAPFGPAQREEEKLLREFFYSEEDTRRRQMNRDERLGIPSFVTTTKVPDTQKLSFLENSALQGNKRVGAPNVDLEKYLSQAQRNRRLMGI